MRVPLRRGRRSWSAFCEELTAGEFAPVAQKKRELFSPRFVEKPIGFDRSLGAFLPLLLKSNSGAGG